MSKYFSPAPTRSKAKSSQRSTRPAATSPAPTSSIVAQCQKCVEVEFVLHSGTVLQTKADSLVEDDDVIMGELADGRLFAVPCNSVAYFVEV